LTAPTSIAIKLNAIKAMAFVLNRWEERVFVTVRYLRQLRCSLGTDAILEHT
jgi:hypothetical protein